MLLIYSQLMQITFIWVFYDSKMVPFSRKWSFIVKYLLQQCWGKVLLLKNISFVYPLRMSENLWFSEVFRGYPNETLG